MKCPYCGFVESKVIDSRPTEDGYVIRRRRQCLSCSNRFTTYEKVEEVQLIVVKKDGTRESFNRGKIINGLVRACEKRPISIEVMENIADRIEQKLINSMEQEIPSGEIGELLMEELKALDEVAYVRFASVYRQFKDLNTFVKELTKMLDEKKD
ncbi:MAG: NrdR family transcriptional regulator [delta proteobacterium ML8_F1]|nr:MAG: NrdR family transcriptional regulator [delta proteobacterium ML8_F1]